MFEGVSENSRHMGVRDLRYHSSYGCKRPVVSSEKLCYPRKTQGHRYHPDLELSDRSRERLEMEKRSWLSRRLRVA